MTSTGSSTNGGLPTPPQQDLMEELGLRIRVSFPDFLALPPEPTAPASEPAAD